MKYTLVEGYNFHFNFQPQTLNPLIMSLLPVIMLPLLIPLWGCCSIYLATSTFSVPKSDLTRDGSPNLSEASKNKARTVSALLFEEHLRYTILLLKPSMPP